MLFVAGLVAELEKSPSGDFCCKWKKELGRCPLLLTAKAKYKVQEAVYYNLKLWKCTKRNTAVQAYIFDQSFVTYTCFDANFPGKYQQHVARIDLPIWPSTLQICTLDTRQYQADEWIRSEGFTDYSSFISYMILVYCIIFQLCFPCRNVHGYSLMAVLNNL